jgi:hypothetical protein
MPPLHTWWRTAYSGCKAKADCYGWQGWELVASTWLARSINSKFIWQRKTSSIWSSGRAKKFADENLVDGFDCFGNWSSSSLLQQPFTHWVDCRRASAHTICRTVNLHLFHAQLHQENLQRRTKELSSTKSSPFLHIIMWPVLGKSAQTRYA